MVVFDLDRTILLAIDQTSSPSQARLSEEHRSW